MGVSRPDYPNFLSTPIISEMGKAANFKFCTYTDRIDQNKRPLKISAKVAVGVLRDSRKFKGHPSRGHFCSSSAFLYCYSSDEYSTVTSVSHCRLTFEAPRLGYEFLSIILCLKTVFEKTCATSQKT